MRNNFGFPYLQKMYQQKDPKEGFGFIVAVIIFVILATILYAKVARAGTIDLKIIAQIESSNNPNAVSYAGAINGRGLYQISEICLKDYNIQNNAKISPTMLFDPKTNEMVAKWYLTQRIPFLLQKKGIPVTTANILWAYNAGVGKVKSGIMPQETRNYIKKYSQLRASK